MIGHRLTKTFTRGKDGQRPVYGAMEKFQTDPHWRDLILFHEYFHGDNGAGIGASHQTGWTGTVALLYELEGALRLVIYEINTAVWLAGRRLDEVVLGVRRAAGGRGGLADGRVGAQPGGAGDRADRPGAGGGQPRGAARPARRRT